MSDQPLVSVVIPCYNHEQFVKDSIQSVIDQTYENIELIIIDDGSSDRSVEKIQEMVDSCKERFTHFEFRHRPNKGLSATLNEAIDWCQGEYYSAIASDDIILSKKTEIQVNFLNKNQDISAVFGFAKILKNDNKLVIEDIAKKNTEYYFNDIFLHNYYLPAVTQMIRKESLMKVGLYNPEYKIEDLYMWLKLTYSGSSVYLLGEYLAVYRIHGDNTIYNYELMHIERMKIINNYTGHSLYKEAISKINKIHISELALKEKLKSIKLIFKFFLKNPKSLFDFKFLGLFLFRLFRKS